MDRSDGGARRKRFRVETVRGEPYSVGGRRLIPVARVVSWGRARGTIGTDQISGWGSGFVRVVPLSVLEETAEGERRIAIANTTAMALRALVGVAMAMTLLFTTVRWLARRLRGAGA
jgi:uncharacterized spore protein YtfJ